MIDRTRVDRKLGDYGVANATALADPALLGRVQEARRLARARTRAVAREDIATELPAADYHVSRKYDGEFTVLVWRDGEAFTINEGGTVRVGLPFLAEAAGLFQAAGLDQAMVVGEIYILTDGRPGRYYDAMPALRNPASQAEIARLRFAVFDILEPHAGPYAETWKRIQAIFGAGKLIHPVDGTWANKVEIVDKLYVKWVEGDRAEGIVARSDAAGQFKIKPRLTLDLVVVGYTEGAGDRRGLVHDLLTAVLRPDGTFHLLGRIGGGLTEDERRSFCTELRDLAAESDYTEVNLDHVAYQMVRPEWVIEIQCIDLLTETTRGGPIERMVLAYRAGKYEIVRRLPLASLIGPSFVRRRTDKQARPEDAGVAQITDVVEIHAPEARDATKLTLQTSELLRREVYVKTLRGAKMVRKLLLWKTNKDRDAAEYPAYVVYLTDFSPNRQTPLEREIRVASTSDAAEAMWKELADKYVVGGWVKV